MGIFERFSGIVTGFLSCLVLGLIMAFSQQRNRYLSERDILDEFSNIYRTGQTRQFKIFTTSPTLNELEKGEIVILSSSTKNIFTRIDQSLYFAVLRST